jgi:hypothetical protein
MLAADAQHHSRHAEREALLIVAKKQRGYTVCSSGYAATDTSC